MGLPQSPPAILHTHPLLSSLMKPENGVAQRSTTEGGVPTTVTAQVKRKEKSIGKTPYWCSSFLVLWFLFSVTVEFIARISGEISKFPLRLPQLEWRVSDRMPAGCCGSEPKPSSASEESLGRLSLPLLRISSTSKLRRWEIFRRSSPISRSSSTFARRSPPESSASSSKVGTMRGGGLDGSSRTYAWKSFLEGLILVQKTSRKFFRQPRS